MAPKVLVFNNQRDVPLSTSSVRLVVKEFLLLAKRKTDEVSIYFVTEKKITSLHEEFFNDPSPTDCISLPMDEAFDEPYHILGEIFICPKTAIKYLGKKDLKKRLYEELTLYLIHGLLHLSGYDDQSKSDRQKMRRLEKKYMSCLTAFITRKKVLT